MGGVIPGAGGGDIVPFMGMSKEGQEGGSGDGDTFVFNIPPDFIAAIRNAPEEEVEALFRRMGRKVRNETNRKTGRRAS
jgi:hypothetical protein